MKWCELTLTLFCVVNMYDLSECGFICMYATAETMSTIKLI